MFCDFFFNKVQRILRFLPSVSIQTQNATKMFHWIMLQYFIIHPQFVDFVCSMYFFAFACGTATFSRALILQINVICQFLNSLYHIAYFHLLFKFHVCFESFDLLFCTCFTNIKIDCCVECNVHPNSFLCFCRLCFLERGDFTLKNFHYARLSQT